MKRTFFMLLFLTTIFASHAQKIDTIAFHLYTDSLKKGTHNYINVDGKGNNRWIPLTTKDVTFTSSYGQFEGNDLVLPDMPKVDKVTIRAALKSNPAIQKETTLWIKQHPDDEILPTREQVLKNGNKTPPKKKDRN